MDLIKDLLFSLISGLGNAGAVYAIMAVAIVVAFRGSGVINFATGATAAFTAMVFNELHSPTATGNLVLPWFDFLEFMPEKGILKDLHLTSFPTRVNLPGDGPVNNFWAVVLALCVAALIGLMLHFLVFRPLRNAPALAKVIGSLAAMLWLQSCITINFGTQTRSDIGWNLVWSKWTFQPTAEPLGGKNFLGLGAGMPRANMFMFMTALALTIIVWAAFRYTRFGLSTRAADENEKGAALLGYSPQLIAGWNWVISSLIAGFAGIMFVAFTQPPQMTLFIDSALGAALIGNLTSILGAGLGGLAIGAIASMGARLAGEDWWPSVLPSDGVRRFIPLLVVILILYFRGGKLPIRGSISVGRQPSAPATKNAVVGALIPGLLVGFAISVFSGRWEIALTASMVATLFMFSLVVLIGFLGQISLAQWSLAGLSAFVMIRLAADGKPPRTEAIFNDGPNLPVLLALIGGVAAAVVVGVLVGLPALRIRGVQLAVVTVCAVTAIEDLLLNNSSLMGAASEGNNPVPLPEIFGQYVGGPDPRLDPITNLPKNTQDYWKFGVFALIVTALVGLAVVNLRRGGTGRRFLAVRANERAAAAAGINVANAKLLGFAIASGIAGIAGVMFAFKTVALTKDNYGLFFGLALLAFAYIGGITTVWGSIIGGTLIAGGLVPALLSWHLGDEITGYIAAIGAAGLLVNAIVTNGEGVALLQAHQGKELKKALRRPPSDEVVPEPSTDKSLEGSLA